MPDFLQVGCRPVAKVLLVQSRLHSTFASMQEVSQFSASEVSVKTFKETFCEHFKCAPESFLWELLKRSLYPRARPLARLIYWFKPAAMFRLLEQAGLA